MHLPNHGANPRQLTKLLHLPFKEHAVDFSVNTTPFELQSSIKENWQQYITTISKYPDPSSEQLRVVIAAKENISINEILVGNGAAQLIFLIAQFFSHKRVTIVEPTFSEYRDACATFGCEVDGIIIDQPWNLDVENIINQAKNKDLLFICNPNNPTGVAYLHTDLLFIIESLSKYDVMVVIDEAFYDFQINAPTIISYIKKFPNLIVLRSLTKMYGIAGIRLGYVASQENLIKKLSPLQNPWSVNGLAQRIGQDCLKDDLYVSKVQNYIARERERIFPLIQGYGFETSLSEVNFYLLKEMDKKTDLMPLIKFLIERGIIPRHTYNFPSLDGKFIRLAIKNVEENNRLLEVLQLWKDNHRDIY